MKSTLNFLLTTIFLAIFTLAVALVKIRRKMLIREKLFVNFIKNGVIIDINLTFLINFYALNCFEIIYI